MHRARAPFSTRARRRVAILTTLALAAGLAGFSQANAATTIVPTPAETGIDGPVVRNDSIELKEDNGGRLFTRTSSSGNFTQQSTGLAYGLSGCLGNITPPAPSARNNSPRSRIVVNGPRVTGPVGTTGPVVLSASSPAKSLALFSSAESVITPPPAAAAVTPTSAGPGRPTCRWPASRPASTR